MSVIPIQYVEFNHTATLAMGEALDRACKSVLNSGSTGTVREIIAKRIIAAAKNGDVSVRLHEQALVPFGIEDMSMLYVSVGRDSPIPVYASVTLQRDHREPRPMLVAPQSPAHRSGALSLTI